MSRIVIATLTLVSIQPMLAAQANGRTLATGPAAGSYLPLAVGKKWVLVNPNQKRPVIFEVVKRTDEGFLLQSTTPWGSSEWTLSEDGGKFFMMAYGVGTGAAMMPMPDGPLYLDFGRGPGEKWSNALGTLSVVSRSTVVRSGNRTYSDCVEIEHKAKKTRLWSTFARGIGYVRFGQGDAAFVLNEAASVLPDSVETPSQVHLHERKPTVTYSSPEPAKEVDGRVLIGLTPNRLAREPLTEAVMKRRLQQTVDAGVTFISGTAKWAELESVPGRYSLGSIETFLAAAQGANLPVSYTIRVIDTISRDVPADLRNQDWADPRMRTRALALIEAVAPLLKRQVRWFSFGYEIDSYLAKHPAEIAGFTALHQQVAARLKEIIPGIQMTSTLTYSGLASLSGQLKNLNSRLDCLALTYCPLRPDFTVQEPSMVSADFAAMKHAAAGRKILLEEIGYPTAGASGSSEDKQAEFYRLALDEIRRDQAAFAAVNFMNLADLSHETARQFTDFYGLQSSAFEGVLRTMGLFDESGKPKRSWSIFESALKR